MARKEVSETRASDARTGSGMERLSSSGGCPESNNPGVEHLGLTNNPSKANKVLKRRDDVPQGPRVAGAALICCEALERLLVFLRKEER